jgi:hypothetical protein
MRMVITGSLRSQSDLSIWSCKPEPNFQRVTEWKWLWGREWISCCCRRQHTILNMKYCVYVCPVSLAELCIAKRQLDFLHVRMFECLFGWSDLWRFLTSQEFKKITYSRSRFDFPNTLGCTSRTPPWTMTNCKHVSVCLDSLDRCLLYIF